MTKWIFRGIPGVFKNPSTSRALHNKIRGAGRGHSEPKRIPFSLHQNGSNGERFPRTRWLETPIFFYIAGVWNQNQPCEAEPFPRSFRSFLTSFLTNWSSRFKGRCRGNPFFGKKNAVSWCFVCNALAFNPSIECVDIRYPQIPWLIMVCSSSKIAILLYLPCLGPTHIMSSLDSWSRPSLEQWSIRLYQVIID